MRWALPTLLALLMVASSLPVLQGQAATVPAGATGVPAPVQVLTDAANDQSASVSGTPAGTETVGNPGGRYAASDLVSLTVEEQKSDLLFHLAVASLSTSPEAPFVESSIYRADFAYGGNVYRIQFARVVQPGGAAQYSGRAYVYDSTRGAFDPVESLIVSADTTSNSLTADLPRDVVLDQHGGEPFPGTQLTDFHVSSASIFSQGGGFTAGPLGNQAIPKVDVTDNMPDQGNGTDPLTIQIGLRQDGNARLQSLVPFRASNGEATTMVFQVNATNLGPKQRFALEATGQPATWQVDLPSDIIELPAQSSIPFPVLVSMPFAHAHGTVSSFVVTMTGLDNPGDVGRVQLGVRFTQPPQPAGHHDTLFLHAEVPEGDQTLSGPFATAFGFDPNHLYFNTLSPDEDSNDAKIAVGGQSFGFTQTVPPLQTYHWTVPLSPILEMGLDFDEARQGDAKVSVSTTLPMQGAKLSGRMVYTMPDLASRCGRFGQGGGNQRCSYDDQVFGPGQHLTVATLGPSATQDVGPNAQDVLFEMPILPTKDGDYVLYHPDASLAMEFNLTFLRADGFVGPHDIPKITGGELDKMPLNEYHDPVTQVFTSISSLMIIVQGEQQRLVNPGKTALYQLTLMNHDNAPHSYDLDLSGPGVSWTQVVGPRRIDVPAGQTRQLGIAVTAPANAVDGDKSDVVLAAINTKDTSERTLARLLTTVDTKAPHPDDSALVPGLASKLTTKKSPGLEPEVVALGLAALALAVRRRRAA